MIVYVGRKQGKEVCRLEETPGKAQLASELARWREQGVRWSREEVEEKQT